jgi:hypothetical protein
MNQLLETPNSKDAQSGRAVDWEKYKSEGMTSHCRLRNQIAALLPTPSTSEATGSPYSQQGAPDLHSVIRLVATPDGAKTGLKSHNDSALKLSPEFEMWMQGLPLDYLD